MGFRYLFCGAWSFKAPPGGITVFRAKGSEIETNGVWGAELQGQSILAVSGERLVSICELPKGGHAVSYAIGADGTLEKKDVLDFDSAKLSYVCAAPNGRYVFISSMDDGTVKMVRLASDGTLTLADEWKLTGHSVTQRQGKAKVHSVMTSPDGSLLAAANLGADEVELFQVDYGRECLRLVCSVPVDFGRMPRHMAFSPDGSRLYVLTEDGNRIYVYTVSGTQLLEKAAYHTLNPAGKQVGQAADIVVSADGRFVYSTNRGQNNIAVWRALGSGLLDCLGFFPCGGEGPRGLNLSPDGRTLFCANNESGTIAVLPMDPVSGLPGTVTRTLEVPCAGCVRSL